MVGATPSHLHATVPSRPYISLKTDPLSPSMIIDFTYLSFATEFVSPCSIISILCFHPLFPAHLFPFGLSPARPLSNICGPAAEGTTPNSVRHIVCVCTIAHASLISLWTGNTGINFHYSPAMVIIIDKTIPPYH